MKKKGYFVIVPIFLCIILGVGLGWAHKLLSTENPLYAYEDSNNISVAQSSGMMNENEVLNDLTYKDKIAFPNNFPFEVGNVKEEIVYVNQGKSQKFIRYYVDKNERYMLEFVIDEGIIEIMTEDGVNSENVQLSGSNNATYINNTASKMLYWTDKDNDLSYSLSLIESPNKSQKSSLTKNNTNKEYIDLLIKTAESLN